MKSRLYATLGLMIWLLIHPTVEVGAESWSRDFLIKYKNIDNPQVMTLNPSQVKKMQADPRVDYLEPDFEYRGAMIPNDFYFANQWYLKRIRADKAWNIANQSYDIVIAVIDTGVQINHPDLKNNIWINKKEIAGNGIDDDHDGYIDDINGWDFVNNVPDPSPKFTVGYTADGVVHGTVVAGVLAAAGNNGAGVAGVTWQAQIMPLKALNDRGVTDTVKVVKAINYAIKQKVNIINLSFIGPNYSRALAEAIARAYQAGIIVVAAGGNDLGQGFGQNLTDKPMYPVCLDGKPGENMVIGVGATDALDRKTSFSGFGKCIDIAAPGISIFNTTVYAPARNKADSDFNNLYDGYWSGTSLAVPMVSGAIALMQQVNPSLKPKQIIKTLFASADVGKAVNDPYADQIGNGRLNVYEAVARAKAMINDSATGLLVGNAVGDVFKLSPTATDSLPMIKLPIAVDKKWSLATIGDHYVVASRNKIKLFNKAGLLITDWPAFDNSGIDSLSLAVGDVNDDDQDEIIVAVNAKGYAPEVRIFNQQGKLLNKFLAYDKNFRGGVNLTVGDTDNQSSSQIITAPASIGSPQIKVFAASGRLLSQFMADDRVSKGNWQIAVTDVYSSIKTEARIIFYYSDGSSPYIKIFTKDGILRRKFAITDLKKPEVLRIVMGDLNNDGRAEIACLAKNGNELTMKIYRDNGFWINNFKIKDKAVKTINTLTTVKFN